MEVPMELRRRPHWIVWKSINRKGKHVKLPFNARTGHLASTTDPATWSTYQEAATALATRQYAGVGFVFAKNDCLFGLDLDSCLVDFWTVANWASDILRSFCTYAERSPSGTGIKVYAIGEHQAKGCIKPIGEIIPGMKRPAVEVYGWGRYFAFTGKRLEDSLCELYDCREPLSRLLATMKPVQHIQPYLPQTPYTGEKLDRLTRASAYLRKVPPASHDLAGCNNRTFRAACFLLHDLKLTLEECNYAMWRWNQAGTPPWSEIELFRKISDAAKKGHA